MGAGPGLVARYIATAGGPAELDRVQPRDDRAALEQELAEAGEAIAYLRAAASPQAAGQGAAIRINLNGLPDVTASVQKLRIEGAALEPREIFDLIAFLDRAADAGSFLNAAAERFPLLAARAAVHRRFPPASARSRRQDPGGRNGAR